MILPYKTRQKLLSSFSTRNETQTSGLQKKTLRFTQQQISFLESFKEQLHDGAAFNDAVSAIVDLAMACNVDPLFTSKAAEGQLWDLFAFHNLPAIHFNTVLTALDIPSLPLIQTNQAGAVFQHLLPHFERLGRAFHISTAYLTGASAHPYVIPIQRPFYEGLLTDLQEKTISSLQPRCSLLTYKCPEAIGLNTMMYFRTEYQLNIHKNLSMFCPIGVYLEKDKAVAEYRLLSEREGLRYAELTIESSTLNRLIQGSFLPEEAGRTLPGISY